MTIQQLLNVSPGWIDITIGFKLWNGVDPVPDKTTAFIACVKEFVLAISGGGNIYYASKDKPNWDPIN